MSEIKTAIFIVLLVSSVYAQAYDKAYINALSQKESLSKTEIQDVCDAMENGWEGGFHGQCQPDQWARITERVKKYNKEIDIQEKSKIAAKIEAAVPRLNPKKYSYPDFYDILHNDFFANQQISEGVVFISQSSPSILFIKRAKFGMTVQYPRAGYREHLTLKRGSMLIEYFPYLKCELKQRSAKSLFGEDKSYSACEEIDRFESEAAQQYIEYPEQ